VVKQSLAAWLSYIIQMTTHKLFPTVLLLFTSIGTTFAQAINNTVSYKNINAPAYIRLNYENDVFSATDQYYTQGIHLELVAPWVGRFPLAYTLFRLSKTNTRYGIGIEHNGYTPSSISSDAILYGDRPFTANLSFKTFAISIDSAKKQRLTAAVSTGIIGPGAGGKQMQESIHKWLNNITPHGWDNQIHNDMVLNYEVTYERQLFSYRNIFALNGIASGRLGTLSDKATLGAVMMIGCFDDPFNAYIAAGSARRHLRVYAYEHPQVSAIGYDATLQGGLFNRSSPYTISASDITRFTFQNRFGFVVNYQRLFLEYFQSVSSNEFTTAKMHVWGGVQIAVGL